MDEDKGHVECGIDEDGNPFMWAFDESGKKVLTIDKDGMKDENGKLMRKEEDEIIGYKGLREGLTMAIAVLANPQMVDSMREAGHSEEFISGYNFAVECLYYGEQYVKDMED